eukprot:GHVS01024221.1.p1 GENE.GHVS01024221.1~~GHVS01024221.1.p1  ORF type:complete len:490 (+),score=74.60 GHVS01024221.1:97-1566(+)
MNLSRPIMLLLPLVAIVLFAIQPGFCMKEGDAVVATAEDKVDATSNEGQVRRIKTGIEESMVPTQQSMVPTQQKENEKLENLRNQYEKRTEAIRTAINKLEEEMKTLTIERERNEHKIEQLTEELRDEIENLQQEIGNLERSADRLTAELADIFTPYSVRHSADTEALIKLQAMYAEATESTKIKLEKRDEIENLQQQATADLQKAETKLQPGETGKPSEEIENLQQEIENLQQQIKRLKESKVQLTAELDDIFTPYTLANEARKEELEALQAMYEDVMASKNIKQKELDKTRDEIKEKQELLQKAETKLDKPENQALMDLYTKRKILPLKEYKKSLEIRVQKSLLKAEESHGKAGAAREVARAFSFNHNKELLFVKKKQPNVMTSKQLDLQSLLKEVEAYQDETAEYKRELEVNQSLLEDATNTLRDEETKLQATATGAAAMMATPKVPAELNATPKPADDFADQLRKAVQKKEKEREDKKKIAADGE